MLGISTLLFGPQLEPALDKVQEGHRAIDVIIEDQRFPVDVDALADVSGLFLQVQSTNAVECPLKDFPGGVATFRQVVNLLTTTQEHPSLAVQEDTIMDLFEAAWLLECPRIFDEIMDSPYMRSLSSRRKVELLETLLPFTSASSPTEGFVQERSLNDDIIELDEFMQTFLLETKMWQRTERAAIELCAQLDTSDFMLGPRLATGSLRVSCELLRLQGRREEEQTFVSNAFQPVAAMWKNLTDKPLRAKVSWDAHLFALHCMRKRLPSASSDQDPANQAGLAESQEDEQAKADISNEVCDLVPDSLLLGLVELVEYIDIHRTPPNWASLLIRALLLSDRIMDAYKAFTVAFPTSPRVQELVWRANAVPPAWLAGVAEHLEASKVLLRVLMNFREIPANELCDLIEDVLIKRFLSLPHAGPVVMASELVNEVVGACFEAARKARDPGASAGDESTQASYSRCPAHWAGQHVLWRLHHTGTRLFSVAFVSQRGFLPHTWPDCLGSGAIKLGEEDVRVEEEPPCRLEALVIKPVGSCLWDEGLLSLDLLNPIMDAGRTVPNDPILHYGRQIIMRHLWCTHAGSYLEVPRLKVLWELACWPLCTDAGLIREALEYLKGAYCQLHAFGGQWHPEYDELMFQMYCALDLSRLPVQALLSPWVPPQVQMVNLLVQQQPSEEFHAELQQEISSSSERLKSINAQCAKLTNRLNIVEQRTVINKCQINDAMVGIEERQRRKSEVAPLKKP